MPLESLQKLLKAEAKWFEWSEEMTDEEHREYKQALSKNANPNAVIDYILSEDPVFVDGGLAEFLSKNVKLKDGVLTK